MKLFEGLDDNMFHLNMEFDSKLKSTSEPALMGAGIENVDEQSD